MTACVAGLLLGGCGIEKRAVGPAAPLSPPTGPADKRQSLYETNWYEQSEGGRLFRWSGCDSCHSDTSAGAANLADGRWSHGGSVSAIYASIANGAGGMPAYASKLTPQELWQVAGYVKSLPKTKPNMRRRNTMAAQGEPSGATWSGALR